MIVVVTARRRSPRLVLTVVAFTVLTLGVAAILFAAVVLASVASMLVP